MSAPAQEIKLQDLKAKSPAELVSLAEELKVENASTMREQELMFAVVKQLSVRGTNIVGEGVVEVCLPNGFGFLRSPSANHLPGPDDIYVSASQVNRFGLRTGDNVEGHIRSPKEGESHFALLKVDSIRKPLARGHDTKEAAEKVLLAIFDLIQKKDSRAEAIALFVSVAKAIERREI